MQPSACRSHGLAPGGAPLRHTGSWLQGVLADVPGAPCFGRKASTQGLGRCQVQLLWEVTGAWADTSVRRTLLTSLVGGTAARGRTEVDA